MAPNLFKEFCDAFISEVNRRAWRPVPTVRRLKPSWPKSKRFLRQIVDAIGDGVSARTLKDELMALEAREDVLLVESKIPAAAQSPAQPQDGRTSTGRRWPIYIRPRQSRVGSRSR